MSLPMVYKYPYDITGTSATNYVDGEKHSIKMGDSHMVVFRSGPFYTKSMVIRDFSTGKELEEGKDYKFRGYYKRASEATAKEVATIIEFVNPNYSGAYKLYAQVVGGEFSHNDAVIIDLLLAVIEDNREVTWDSIENMPKLFTPSPHMHLADTDLVGTGSLVAALGHIEEAILVQNAESITEALLKEINTKVSKHGPVKVSLEDATYVVKDVTSTGLRVSMPKSHFGEAAFTFELVIEGPTTTDLITVAAKEDGSGFSDVVYSRSGNNTMDWALGLTSNYVGLNSLDIDTRWIRENIDLTQYRFTLKSFTVFVEDPKSMTGVPKWKEGNPINSIFTKANIVDNTYDPRNFVTRNDNKMLQATRSYAKIDYPGDNYKWVNGGEGYTFGVLFPKMLTGTEFEYTLEVDLIHTEGDLDLGLHPYIVHGKYHPQSKFTVDRVECASSPKLPFLVYGANGSDLEDNYPILFSCPKPELFRNRGYVTIRSMTVTDFHEESWAEDWGLIVDPRNYSVVVKDDWVKVPTIGHRPAFLSPNQEEAFRKVLFSNGVYSTINIDDNLAPKGIKLKLPKASGFQVTNGEMAVDLTVQSRETHNIYSDRYRFAWSQERQSLEVAWCGMTAPTLLGFVDEFGYLQLRSEKPLVDVVIVVESIMSTNRYSSNIEPAIEWVPRNAEDEKLDDWFITGKEPEVPLLKQWATERLNELSTAIDLALKTKFDKAGGELTGPMYLDGDGVYERNPVTMRQFNALAAELREEIAKKMNITGGTFTGRAGSNLSAQNPYDFVRKHEFDAALGRAINPTHHALRSLKGLGGKSYGDAQKIWNHTNRAMLVILSHGAGRRHFGGGDTDSRQNSVQLSVYVNGSHVVNEACSYADGYHSTGVTVIVPAGGYYVVVSDPYRMNGYPHYRAYTAGTASEWLL